jgi:transporter family-2 protein
MKSPLFFQTLVAMAGVALTIQAGLNGQLRHSLQNPFLASIASFIVGTLALVAFALLTRNAAVPSDVEISGIVWYKWLGGLLGAFYVASVVIGVSEIGAASMVALLVAFQLLSAVVCDHFGWMGFPVHPISLGRAVGVALLLVGAYLVTRN